MRGHHYGQCNFRASPPTSGGACKHWIDKQHSADDILALDWGEEKSAIESLLAWKSRCLGMALLFPLYGIFKLVDFTGDLEGQTGSEDIRLAFAISFAIGVAFFCTRIQIQINLKRRFDKRFWLRKPMKTTNSRDVELEFVAFLKLCCEYCE